MSININDRPGQDRKVVAEWSACMLHVFWASLKIIRKCNYQTVCYILIPMPNSLFSIYPSPITPQATLLTTYGIAFLIVVTATAVAVVIFTKHFQYPCKCSCFCILLIVFLLAKIEWQWQSFRSMLGKFSCENYYLNIRSKRCVDLPESLLLLLACWKRARTK